MDPEVLGNLLAGLDAALRHLLDSLSRIADSAGPDVLEDEDGEPRMDASEARDMIQELQEWARDALRSAEAAGVA